MKWNENEYCAKERTSDSVCMSKQKKKKKKYKYTQQRQQYGGANKQENA